MVFFWVPLLIPWCPSSILVVKRHYHEAVCLLLQVKRQYKIKYPNNSEYMIYYHYY
ncbi:hypothetical protein CLU79DRAFT_739239 [Phycomyces nitens]|nr:hypothetical protein CLU79DRAFT_739239 [Phycomyces nitens]